MMLVCGCLTTPLDPLDLEMSVGVFETLGPFGRDLDGSEIQVQISIAAYRTMRRFFVLFAGSGVLDRSLWASFVCF